jgi:nonribosomal peptide synthetase DhbF
MKPINLPASHKLTIIQAFGQVVQSYPHRIAVTTEHQNWSYRELNALATRVAANLIKMGVQPTQPVAISMTRGISMLACLLGVLRAGGCYVPLEPDLPMARLQFILNEAQPAALITTKALAPTLEWAGPTLIAPSEAQTDTGPQIKSIDWPVISELAPAYIIYTSGSTGLPKGVVVPHNAVVNMARGQAPALGLKFVDSG